MSQKLHFLLLPLIWSFYMPLSNGQTYFLSVSQETFEPLQLGFPLTNGIWDDPSYIVPIGFEFELFDQVITDLESSDILVGGSLGVDFSGNTTSVIHVFGPDLIDRGYQTGTSMSTIYFRTEGIAGQRVFTQEWHNVGFFGGEVDNGVYVDFVNFQLKLYEASGDIVFHFGPNSITNEFQDYGGTGGPSVGLVKELDLQGALQAEEVILLSGSPSGPDVISEFVETYLTGTIPENTVYRFSKMPSGTHDPIVSFDKSYLVPNPTNGYLTLHASLAPELIFPISIYDLQGAKVKTISDASSLQLFDLARGIYEARFLTTEGPAGQRIVLD